MANVSYTDIQPIFNRLETAFAEEGVAGLHKVVTIEWGNRRSAESVKYCSIVVHMPDGATLRPYVRFANEIACSIPPKFQEDVQERAGGKFKPQKPRGDRKPSLTVKSCRDMGRYTEPDGITPKLDAEGRPLEPPAESRSMLARVIELLSIVFRRECQELTKRASRVALADDDKKAEAFAAVTAKGLISGVSMIALESQRADFGEKAGDPTILWVPTTKVATPVQDAIGDGPLAKRLLNPLVRVQIDFKSKRKTELYAAESCHREADKKGEMKTVFDFIRVTYRGRPEQDLNDENVHLAVLSGSQVTGTAYVDVCISNLAISLVAKCGALIVRRPDPAAAGGIDAIGEDLLSGFEVNENYCAEGALGGGSGSGSGVGASGSGSGASASGASAAGASPSGGADADAGADGSGASGAGVSGSPETPGDAEELDF